MRLNSYIAKAGVASRRKADEFIKAGRVKINGRPGQLNDEVSDSDKVELDGQLIKQQRYRYILLYKPVGYITTLADPENRPTILDLLSIEERIVPVGRLDFNTTGALLLTNDGELAHKLMHPSFEVDKVYEAEVTGEITTDKLHTLAVGVEIDGQKTAPAKAKAITKNKIELTIHEGRQHQVKKMLASVGLPVKKLHRPKYGPLNLNGLKSGELRDLTASEVEQLKH